jgi:rare lipoprotein A
MVHRWICQHLIMALVITSGCRSTSSARSGMARETGFASYYAHKYHGRTTASGERFDMNAMTAAHKTLPFGTKVKVTNLDNGRSVIVRITDRGPFVKGRVIDLSLAAAKKLDMVRAGVAEVEVRPARGESLALAR